MDFAKATDVDLYFSNEDKNAGVEGAKQFIEDLNYIKKIFEASDKEYGMANTNKVVGQFFMSEIMKFVQVIWTPFNAQDLLLFFDISTHCVAITSRWEQYFGLDYTKPEDPPKIITYNKQTAERYLKICKRYGHEPKYDPMLTASLHSWTC